VWFVSDVINDIRTKGIFKNDLHRFDSLSEFINSNCLSRAVTLFVHEGSCSLTNVLWWNHMVA
jgi:hypothetical protein